MRLTPEQIEQIRAIVAAQAGGRSQVRRFAQPYWIDMRRLRNQMVHEYVDDPVILASALQAGHRFVPAQFELARRLEAL